MVWVYAPDGAAIVFSIQCVIYLLDNHWPAGISIGMSVITQVAGKAYFRTARNNTSHWSKLGCAGTERVGQVTDAMDRLSLSQNYTQWSTLRIHKSEYKRTFVRLCRIVKVTTTTLPI